MRRLRAGSIWRKYPKPPRRAHHPGLRAAAPVEAGRNGATTLKLSAAGRVPTGEDACLHPQIGPSHPAGPAAIGRRPEEGPGGARSHPGFARPAPPRRAPRRLDRAAAAHSLDMVRHRYFDHTSPTGSTPLGRVRASGYLAHARAWMAGENIAWGVGRLAAPAAIVSAWMHSPGHRANILRPQFREVGTGVVAGVPAAGVRLTGATYTQDFGARG